MKKINKILMGILAIYSLSITAFAQTSTNNFQVASTLNGACVINVTDIDFGVIKQSQDNLVNSNINFLCSNGVRWIASFGAGSGTTSQRTLVNTQDSTEKLNYNLYKNGRGGNPVGAILSDSAYIYDGSGTSQFFTIIAKVPAGQYVTPGTYSDIITVSVSY